MRYFQLICDFILKSLDWHDNDYLHVELGAHRYLDLYHFIHTTLTLPTPHDDDDHHLEAYYIDIKLKTKVVLMSATIKMH